MSTTAFPSESITLQLADPWTLADFTDITPLVREWTGTTEGRQHELQMFQPGQVAVVLDNGPGGGNGRFSPWNTEGPYYNLLTPGDASAETADGTVNTQPVVSNWLNGTATNCIIAVNPPPVVIDGPTAYEMVSSSTSMSVLMPDNYYAVDAGKSYSIMCSFLAGSTGRTCTLTAKWYTSGGSHISGDDVTCTATDNSSTWTKASLLGTIAPATAAFVAFEVSMPSASTEGHWFSRAALFHYYGAVPNTAWGPGQRGLVPGRPIQCTATWDSVTYNVWSMYVSNWTPAYKQVQSLQTINCTDALGLLALSDLSSSAYAAQVLADGALSFWRLGDAINSLSAADSGPNNYPLLANNVAFGQTSPILTDDTTVAAFGASSSRPQGVLSGTGLLAAGAQTLELLVSIPVGSTTAQVMFSAANGSVVWFNGANNNLEITFSGEGPPVKNLSVTALSLADGQWHHVAVTCTAANDGTVTAYIDGVQVATATASGGDSSCLFGLGAAFTFGVQTSGTGGLSGSMADIAVYDSVLTGSQVANHYGLFSAGWEVQYSGQRIAELLDVLGWPADLTDIATGVQMVQGATSSLTQTAALSYMQQLEQTEMGAFFCNQTGQITFYDRHYILTNSAATTSNGLFTNDPTDTDCYYYDPGIVPAMDDLDLWNDVPCQRNTGVMQRSGSVLSQKQYTTRSLVGFTGELQTDDADVLAQSQWLLAHYEFPYTRVRQITLSSKTKAGINIPQMLGRSIFDRVTIRWKPIDSSSVYFVQDCLIESIAHKVDGTNKTWTTTWMLSPAETQEYLVLNDATLGQLSTDNRLAY